jgi:S-(hydroxymethyl)glutathione dehydrogenase/alcohol dehydrogenase
MTIRHDGVKVRAAVLPAFDAPLAVEELELLPPGPRDVVVRARAVDLPANDLAMRGREIRSCQYGNVDIRRDLPRFARVLEAGLLDPAAVVDRTYPLADAGKALTAAADRELLTAVLLPTT